MRRIAVGIGVAMLAMLLGSLANANAPTANTTTKTITIRDACDPTSFNAVVGPGTCISGHHGNTLFSDFVGELNRPECRCLALQPDVECNRRKLSVGPAGA
jgi:hypothetical protein